MIDINDVLRHIPYGAQNGVSMKSLIHSTGLSDRTVRTVISKLRIDEGIPIAGDGHGYYRPATREELLRYVIMFNKRAMTALKSIKSAREQLEEMEGQLSIEEVGDYGSK